MYKNRDSTVSVFCWVITLENIDLIGQPQTKFLVIMKDGKILKGKWFEVYGFKSLCENW